MQQEIGLGRAEKILRVSVTWPVTGKTDTYTDVAMDRIYALTEGEPKLVEVERKPIDLARFAPR